MVDKRFLRKEKVKEAIKKAALKIAEKEGWGKVTIRKIADEVLYTPPIVYEFFKNKDDLYRHLVVDGFEKLNALTLASITDEQTPEEKLLKIAEVRFDFVTKNQTLHHIMFDAENPEWHKMELAKSMEAIKELVEGLLLKITGDEERLHEYFFNMICLIKGFTYFQKQVKHMPKSTKLTMVKDSKDFKPIFIKSFRRFINSLKQTHE